MSKALRIVLPILLLSLLITTAGFAQQQTGELVIKVTDPSNAVISGAKVTLTSAVLIKPLTATTDSTGVYRASLLPPGLYKISVSQTGFHTTVRDNVAVEVGRTYPIDFKMAVGAVAETVEVAGDLAQIDTVKSEQAATINTETLLTLPGARDVTDYVRVLPNVNNESMLAGISVNGASGAENVFYVDGIDTSNMYGGTNNQTVRTEMVQELQVKVGGYEAEFGGAQGGVVSIVTKGGGNNFHGMVYYYLGSSSLETAERPTLRLRPGVEPAVAEYITYPKDNYTRNEFGVQLGGPIWKDKAWFFVNVNPTWLNTNRATNTVDENGIDHAGIYNQNQLRRSGDAKIDFQPWQRIRFFAGYTQDTWRWKGGLPTRQGTDSYEFPWSRDGYKYPSYTFHGGFTATVTNKLLVDTRYGMNGGDTIQFLGPNGPSWLMRNSNSVLGFTSTNPLYRVSGWYNQDPNSTGYATVQDYQKKLSFNTTGSLTVNAFGQHNFKFGYNWGRLVWDVISAHPYDYVRFNWGRTNPYGTTNSTCTGPDGNVYTPCGFVEIRSPFGDIAKIHTDRQAFFFQDSWTIKGRLTINPGLRFEKEEIPSFSSLPQYQKAVLKWGYGDKVAPRFGAAYDLFGNGKAKIYGYWGRYFDQMKLGMAEGSFGGFKWHSQYYLMNQAVVDNFTVLGGPHDPAGFSNGCNGSLAGGTVTCAGGLYTAGMQFITDLDWRIPSFDSIDPNLKPMRSTDLSVGTEVEVKKNYIASFSFIHTNLDYTIEDVGVQTPLGESYYTTNPGFGLSVSEFVAAGMPATPKAKRTYNAAVWRLRKQMSNGWMADVSYTYSRLRGNYSGLASSDEDWGGGGRNDPNVERYFDLWFLNYDSHGKFIDGPMNTDRPHQFKVNGTYQLPHNLPMIGAFFQGLSGTPITRAVTVEDAELYVNNRMSDGRTPFFTQTDLYFIQKFKPFKDEAKAIEFNVNIQNLFNQKTVTRKYRLMNRESIYFGCADGGTTCAYNLDGAGDASNLANVSKFLTGWDWQTALTDYNTTNHGTVLDPRFGMNQTFQGPMTVRFGLRFIF